MEKRCIIYAMLLDRHEIMQYLKIKDSALCKRQRDGLPFAKKGRVNYYDIRKVDKWLFKYKDNPDIVTLTRADKRRKKDKK